MKRLFRGRYRVDTVRLPGFDYGRPGWYFVTICTKNRECLFGEVRGCVMGLNDIGCVAHACWRGIPDHAPHVDLGAFVVMPNHVHGLIGLWISSDNSVTVEPLEQKSRASRMAKISPAAGALPVIVRSYKSAVTRLVRQSGESFAWQRRYHDRVVRNERELRAIHDYILNNPWRWHEDRYHARTSP